MFKTNDQFAAANKTAVNSMMTVANTSLASAPCRAQPEHGPCHDRRQR
jgi:hypothetical protein